MTHKVRILSRLDALCSPSQHLSLQLHCRTRCRSALPRPKASGPNIARKTSSTPASTILAENLPNCGVRLLSPLHVMLHYASSWESGEDLDVSISSTGEGFDACSQLLRIGTVVGCERRGGRCVVGGRFTTSGVCVGRGALVWSVDSSELWRIVLGEWGYKYYSFSTPSSLLYNSSRS